MIDLAALALRRAQEQIASVRWSDDRPKRKPPLRIVGKGGRPPSCLCGSCRKCRNREAMREARANRDRPPQKRGRKIDPLRKCMRCFGPIAVVNVTGFCVGCQRRHVRATPARRGGWYSHGGGI